MQTRAALRRFFTAGASETSSQLPLRTGLRMFWVGLLVRLLYLTLAHTYRFRATEDHFQFGWEMGRIARALVQGRGFADPFWGHTGPTAWTPPLYPLLMAAMFRLFGVYTDAAAWSLLAINSVFSAATAPVVAEIAARCYGGRRDGQGVALWSGWLWALYPAAMQYAVRWPWDMALTAFFFSAALALGLRLRGVGGVPRQRSRALWAGLGLFWGLIALSNSSLLIFLPVQAGWIVWPARRSVAAFLAPAAFGAIVFLACLAPWIVRNQRTFHAFVPLRANFGSELYVAVLPSQGGFPWGTHFVVNRESAELHRYARLGELAYSKEQGARAKAIIAADPWRFVRDVLLRFQFYWAGVPHPYEHGVLGEVLRELNYSFLSVAGLLGLALSLHRRVPAAGLFAAAFALLPLIYYIITVQARFRHPLEPLITIFSVYLFRSADRTRLWTFRAAPRQHQVTA